MDVGLGHTELDSALVEPAAEQVGVLLVLGELSHLEHVDVRIGVIAGGGVEQCRHFGTQMRVQIKAGGQRSRAVVSVSAGEGDAAHDRAPDRIEAAEDDRGQSLQGDQRRRGEDGQQVQEVAARADETEQRKQADRQRVLAELNAALALTAMMFQTELFLASASMPLYMVAGMVASRAGMKLPSTQASSAVAVGAAVFLLDRQVVRGFGVEVLGEVVQTRWLGGLTITPVNVQPFDREG